MSDSAVFLTSGQHEMANICKTLQHQGSPVIHANLQRAFMAVVGQSMTDDGEEHESSSEDQTLVARQAPPVRALTIDLLVNS